nr:hypothetical protein BHI3_27260 [Bacteriovorax sp. HI3]
MKKWHLSVLLSSVLFSTFALADGPCGEGRYVYRCFPARCGEPRRCTMVCDGPMRSFGKDKSELVEIKISTIDGNAYDAEDLKIPNEITVEKMCK